MHSISKRFAEAMLPQTNDSALLAGVLFSGASTSKEVSKMKEELERLWKVGDFFFFSFFFSFSYLPLFSRPPLAAKSPSLALAVSSAGIKMATDPSTRLSSTL
jgi:hypothetical protein